VCSRTVCIGPAADTAERKQRRKLVAPRPPHVLEQLSVQLTRKLEGSSIGKLDSDDAGSAQDRDWTQEHGSRRNKNRRTSL
ncbi:unnamed protein product, partial [Tilletia caries]